MGWTKRGETTKAIFTPPIFFPTGSNMPGSTPGSDEDLCQDSSVDSMLTTLEGDSYAFKGGIYWKLTEDSIAPGYPRSIYEDWDGLPAGIQASFSWVNGKTYFFKGSQYWRFDPGQNPPVKSSYPKPISNWDGIPDHIDDVIRYSNGFSYFFKKGF